MKATMLPRWHRKRLPVVIAECVSWDPCVPCWRLMGTIAIMLVCAGFSKAEPGPGCSVPTLVAPPITVFHQPQPPGPLVGPTITAPPIMLFPAESSPPRWCDAPQPPPIKVFRVPPPEVKVFVVEPPQVKLFHVETRPPLWAEAPAPPPIKLFRVETSAPVMGPKVQQPPVTIFRQPQPPAAEVISCHGVN